MLRQHATSGRPVAKIVHLVTESLQTSFCLSNMHVDGASAGDQDRRAEEKQFAQ